MSKIKLIGIDADDTLWHNERYYEAAQTHFVQLLCHYHPEEWIRERLFQTETRNIQHFGYGIKAFVLSMIETGVELTEGRITGQDVGSLIDVAHGMLNAKVELLEQVAETLPTLAGSYHLALITKGDLLDQENKVTRSGLGTHFKDIEIVSHKTPETYARLLTRYHVTPENFVMVGNSLRSDILPVLELGGTGIYIPYATTWQHEAADQPITGTRGFYALAHFGQLPELLNSLEF
ncbi:MAG: HAD family hydrolase [Chloroflexota bacterium]